MAVSDYNTNPDLNTAIAGINIAEGCPPSGINNAIRQLMADVKAEHDTQASSQSQIMTGATASAAGSSGLVPAPAKGKQAKPLRGDGTWADSLTCDITGNAATATTATSAATLATARTLRTNLASTATASFDGSADITPGVTGTLPVTNGGTGATSATAARTALGITLSDSVSSTSSSTFASSKAVKTAYDKAVSAGSNIIQSYRINAGTGISVKAPSGGTHQFIMIYDSTSVDYKITHIGTVAGGTTMTSTQYSDLFRSTVYFWRIA